MPTWPHGACSVLLHEDSRIRSDVMQTFSGNHLEPVHAVNPTTKFAKTTHQERRKYAPRKHITKRHKIAYDEPAGSACPSLITRLFVRLTFRKMQTRRRKMKSFILVGCAAAAALFVTADTASAQCGYGGGYYGGSGISIGYSSFGPRTSFNVGYSRVPSYGYSSYRSNYRSRGHYGYHPTSVYRHGNHLHIQPSRRSSYRRRW